MSKQSTWKRMKRRQRSKPGNCSNGRKPESTRFFWRSEDERMADKEGWQISGHLVRFDVPDLVDDVFTKDTDFHGSDRARNVPIFFEHSEDPVFGVRKIGTGSLEPVSDGVRISAFLFLPRGVGPAVKRLARDSLLG